MKYLKLYEDFDALDKKKASELSEELYKITDQLYFNNIVVVQASVKLQQDDKIKTGLYINLFKLRSMTNEPGAGKKGMNALIQFADEHNLPIKLTASPYMGSDIDRLTKFYESFGFEVVEEFKLNFEDSFLCKNMIRLPK